MVSIDKLWEIVNNLDNHLEDIISRKVTNIHDTKLYWINASHKLKAIVKDLSEQILFFTASIVDM